MKKLILILLSIIFLSSTAYAKEFTLVINNGVLAKPTPIAVVPLNGAINGISGNAISNMISADLHNSGLFAPMSVSAMPQQPTSLQNVSPTSWAKLGVGLVVIGHISNINNQYVISYTLIDVFGAAGTPGTVLLRNNIAVNTNNLNTTINQISDQIFEKLTGEAGDFNTKIAYVIYNSSAEYPYQLYVAGYNGKNPQIIYSSSTPILSPIWKPNTNEVAFTTFNEKKSSIILENVATEGIQTIYSSTYTINGLSFSPNGNMLLFTSSNGGLYTNIYKLNLATNNITQLTSGNGSCVSPAYSANGARIYFTYINTNLIPEIISINANGAAIEHIIPARSSSVAVSPANDYIYFIKNMKLTRLNLTTSYIRTLNPRDMAYHPTVSSNGLMTDYIVKQGGQTSVHLISRNGYARVKLFASNDDSKIEFPSWSY